MEGSQHPPNGLNATSSGQTYPSPPSISPNQQRTGSPFRAVPYAPRTPGTQNMPGSASHLLASYHQQTSQAANRGCLDPMTQNQYQSPQVCGAWAPMITQATPSPSHPQPIVPAGSRGTRALGFMPPSGTSLPYGPSSLMEPASVVQEDEQPTHLVGSQGGHGILPSAPGWPAAPVTGTGEPKNTTTPVQNADGKFPCPHCTKTYLHTKHLKRHLPRRE